MQTDLSIDPYFQEEYAKLYLGGEDELFKFEYRENGKLFKTISIKRPIKTIGTIGVDEGFFDLETAYGYGGYITTHAEKDFLKKAYEAYIQKCRNERIVAEFIRFHPFNADIPEMKELFDFVSEDRPTVYVDCKAGRDERRSGYSSKLRRKLRKCETLLAFEETDDLETFYDLYTSTMCRNRADKFYFFDREYFQKLYDLPFSRLYAVRDDKEIVSTAFVLYGKDIAHIHLSANRSEKMRLNGNYLLFDNIFDKAAENGCKYTFLGGGRTNMQDDTLLRFKRQFSSLTLPFYIAGKIFDKERYRRYNLIWESEFSNRSPRYFLKYRLSEECIG